MEVRGKLNITGGTNTESLIVDSNSLVVKNTGSVGVGTNAPTGKLHVKGNGNTSGTQAFRVENSDDLRLFKLNDEGGFLIGVNGTEQLGSGTAQINIQGSNDALTIVNARPSAAIGAVADNNSLNFAGRNASGSLETFSRIQHYVHSVTAGSSYATMYINNALHIRNDGGTAGRTKASSRSNVFTGFNGIFSVVNEENDTSTTMIIDQFSQNTGLSLGVRSGSAGTDADTWSWQLKNNHEFEHNFGKLSTGDFILNGTADDVFVMDASTNRVGIGTNAPTGKLHIVGNGDTFTDVALRVENSSSILLNVLGDGQVYAYGRGHVDGVNANTGFGVGTFNDSTTGDRQVAIGTAALANVTTGGENTAIGWNAGVNINVGGFNTLVGSVAGSRITSGSSNTFIGQNSGDFLTTGTYNIGMGASVMRGVMTGSYNIGLGHLAGNAITSGTHNLLMGYRAGGSLLTTSSRSIFFGDTAGFNSNGGDNIGIGTYAGFYTSGNQNIALGNYALGALAVQPTTSNYNVAIGNQTLYRLENGGNNVAVGAFAQRNNTSGSTNTSIGYAAGNVNISGSGNVNVGNSAGYYETGSNSLYIHNGLGVSTEANGKTRSLIYGIFNATPANQRLTFNANVGIGVSAGTDTLRVDGTFRYVDGNEASGYVLTSDASGNATWQAAPSGATDTNFYTTGATLTGGTTLVFDRTDTLNAYSVDLSSLKFTGNTSGTCITDIYATNIYGCSPLHIEPSGLNDVYIVENGGNVGIGTATPLAKLQVDGDVTFDFANGETLTINQTNSNAGLTTTATGVFKWQNAGKTVIKAQTISSTGRVGIGAEAFASIAAGVHAFSETDGTIVPHFRVSDAGNNGKFVVWGNGRLDFLGGASDLRLRTNADGKVRLKAVYDGNHYLTITDDTPTVIHKLYTGGGRAGDVNLAITGGDVGIGFTGNPNGKLHVKGPGDTSSDVALLVENDFGTNIFEALGDRIEMFGETSSPLARFSENMISQANIFIIGKNAADTPNSTVMRIDNALSTTTTTLQVNNTGTNSSSALYVNATNGSNKNAITVANGNVQVGTSDGTSAIIRHGRNSTTTHMVNINLSNHALSKGVYVFGGSTSKNHSGEYIGLEHVTSGSANSGANNVYGFKSDINSSSANTVYNVHLRFGEKLTNGDSYGLYSEYRGVNVDNITHTGTHRAGYFKIKPLATNVGQDLNALYGTDVLAGLSQSSMSASTMTGSRILFSNTTGGNIGTAVGLEVDMGNTNLVATNYYAATFEGGNVGIGTATPSATLDLVGTFQYVDGNEASGYVLTSDASGNATWQAAAGGSAPGKYSITTGFTASVGKTITHNLGTEDILVNLWDSNVQTDGQVEVVDSNNITVTMGSTATFKVVVVG